MDTVVTSRAYPIWPSIIAGYIANVKEIITNGNMGNPVDTDGKHSGVEGMPQVNTLRGRTDSVEELQGGKG